MIDLAIELFIGALLVLTCVYCAVLSRRLRVMRDSQRDLMETIATFDAATRRAETNLAAMQGTGASLSRDLADATSRAHALIDELSVMVHAGDNIAHRLEGAVRDVRERGAPIGRQVS